MPSQSHPLFCAIVALSSLLLLYLPHLFLTIASSPLLLFTGTLLLTLLRLDASHRNETQINHNTPQPLDCHSESVNDDLDTDSEPEMDLDPELCFEESFVEWNVRAPLEVIYEEEALWPWVVDSDSDSSSDGGLGTLCCWDSPENIWVRWDEDDREGLIEIALDGKNRDSMIEFQVEEDNLIEIDISPLRINQFHSHKL